MCPVYKATRREHASPRAKANLLRLVISGALGGDRPSHARGHLYQRRAANEVDRLVKQVTDYCIGCGMCAVECPSKVNIPKLVLEAKSRHRERRRASRVDYVLSHAETVAHMGGALPMLTNRLVDLRATRVLGQILLGVDRRRPMAPFAERSLRRLVCRKPAPATPAGDVKAGAAAFFYDLYADCYDPELGLAVIAVLAAHRVETVLPDQRACGIPEMQYGYAGRARRIAETNVNGALAYVEQGATLLSAEPTATFAFKVHYPDYLGSTQSTVVANATSDLGEFLARFRREHPEKAPDAKTVTSEALGIIPRRPGRPDGQIRVAYHQPCHSKAQAFGNPWIELLSQIPGLGVIDLAAGCCGMAGTFGMKTGTYDLSLAVGQPLFDRIEDLAPDLLVSDCSTCRMQLAHATGLPVMHPVTLLLAAYA
jgi:Fe-S oxidoreductase